MSDDPIRLRGHHLLCALTWSGKGHSDAFTLVFDAVVDRLQSGNAVIEVAEGKDDVLCSTLHPGQTPDYHCHLVWFKTRDRIALQQVGHHLKDHLRAQGVGMLRPSVAFQLTKPMLVDMREGFASGQTRNGCAVCSLQRHCTGIAENGYAGARLKI